MTVIETLYNFLASVFIILLLISLFFGQNWQEWRAVRQIKHSIKALENWKNYGIKQLILIIEPLSSESLTDQDIKEFILEMLEFFVIPPSEIKNDIYQKSIFLISQQERRYYELIQSFLPSIVEIELHQIASLLLTTTEINNILKKFRHHLIIKEKTNSYFYILQTASEITQTMIQARTYRLLMDSLLLGYPIGDAIGPVAIKQIVSTFDPDFDFQSDNFQIINKEFYCQKIHFEGRNVYCLRAKGPESRVGNPGKAIKTVFQQCMEEKQTLKMIISIDAYSKLEVEKSGTIAQGLGVAVGSDSKSFFDKYEIEDLAINNEPKINLEAIICRESLEEAVLPMSEEIEAAIPKIIRLLKQIIRTQTQPDETLIVIGIGNALGVSLK